MLSRNSRKWFETMKSRGFSRNHKDWIDIAVIHKERALIQMKMMIQAAKAEIEFDLPNKSWQTYGFQVWKRSNESESNGNLWLLWFPINSYHLKTCHSQWRRLPNFLNDGPRYPTFSSTPVSRDVQTPFMQYQAVLKYMDQLNNYTLLQSKTNVENRRFLHTSYAYINIYIYSYSLLRKIIDFQHLKIQTTLIIHQAEQVDQPWWSPIPWSDARS